MMRKRTTVYKQRLHGHFDRWWLPGVLDLPPSLFCSLSLPCGKGKRLAHPVGALASSRRVIWRGDGLDMLVYGADALRRNGPPLSTLSRRHLFPPGVPDVPARANLHPGGRGVFRSGVIVRVRGPPGVHRLGRRRRRVVPAVDVLAGCRLSLLQGQLRHEGLPDRGDGRVRRRPPLDSGLQDVQGMHGARGLRAPVRLLQLRRVPPVHREDPRSEGPLQAVVLPAVELPPHQIGPEVRLDCHRGLLHVREPLPL
mmetsp:Transcript_984/g.2915  ORF Transcript_984/g.2915 Transcript_984/m.2915 type:complete len:254 (-) Transcript_984:1274-2035(-)